MQPKQLLDVSLESFNYSREFLVIFRLLNALNITQSVRNCLRALLRTCVKRKRGLIQLEEEI